MKYDVTVNGYDSTTGGKVVLSVNGTIINDQIRQLLTPNVSYSGNRTTGVSMNMIMPEMHWCKESEYLFFKLLRSVNSG